MSPNGRSKKLDLNGKSGRSIGNKEGRRRLISESVVHQDLPPYKMDGSVSKENENDEEEDDDGEE